MNLAPKKPNWDLKRDVEKKLAKLEKRTKKAVIEILSLFLAFFFSSLFIFQQTDSLSILPEDKLQNADAATVQAALKYQENQR